MTRSAKSATPKPAKPRSRNGKGPRPSDDATARFDELAKRARSDGPQHVTVKGQDEVVVMSAEDFRRLKGDQTRQALIAVMQASPHREIDIQPRRTAMPVRKVDM